MSVFLSIPEHQHVAANDLAFAIRDRFPVSPGHTLIITRRATPDWFSATDAERSAVMALVEVVKRDLDQQLNPDGYNVGFNAGAAAGQTVPHLHVHVIPRFRGDVPDPRGGVRYVIPDKANYLVKRPTPLTVGGDASALATPLLPLLARAREVRVVSAFVQDSGLRLIQDAVDVALKRGARIHLITGDYLHITQVDALERLLDWQEARDADEVPGVFEARVIEVDRLPGRSRTFHPKAWHLEGEGFAVAFVGSSNLSHAALQTGVEWNVRLDHTLDPAACAAVRAAADALWGTARPLTPAWVAEYAARVRDRAVDLPPGEIDLGEPAPIRAPHEVQVEALQALSDSRSTGRRRAVVVLATGLGKTWLAAFDYAQLWDELGRQPRLLFVAHRRELLLQAARTFRTITHTRGGDARVAWFMEAHSALDAPLVFASVAKLSRPAYASRLATTTFDYVVIDEVHHVATDSYRRILDRIDPVFLLGLTATPDRADGGDVLGTFDDHVAFTADIRRGIALGRLVPFHYFGVKDDVDYTHIPWRNRRFDPATLANAVQTEARMATLWTAWRAHPGTRTLVFCCSVAHAQFVAGGLADRGVRVACVHAGEGSDDRQGALERLGAGDLDAICAVDMFNEGIDVPTIDRVVMLRPTESGVVFLQQLGRGLRAADSKADVTVVDFVGNHRMFLGRLRQLLSFGGAPDADRALRALIDEGELALPDGCAVHLQLEAKPALEAMFRPTGTETVEQAYRALRDERGERPTLGELLRMGLNPRNLRERHRGWFRFVGGEGDLDADAQRVAERHAAFLDDLEATDMSRSFKMVLLLAWLESDRPWEGVDVRDLALASWRILRRDPDLLGDVPESHRLTDPEDPAAVRAWLAYWRVNPIAAWTKAGARKRVWFEAPDGRFAPGFAVATNDEAPLTALVRELVDYRIAMYRRRSLTKSPDGFVCRVTWNQRDPILALPDRARQALPEGETAVRLEDGRIWSFRFAAAFCNVARPVGTERNQLPDLLRRWFGPRAGQPGTRMEVRFESGPEGLWVRPIGGAVLDLPLRGVAAWPDLRAAAGHALSDAESLAPERVMLPITQEGADLFAVRVAGRSMDGGKTPMHDGDWAVMRVARGAPLAQVDGRVVLVQAPGAGAGHTWQIKRLKRRESGWWFTSDNPDGPSFPANEDTTIVARLEAVVRPEDLAPAPGTVLSNEAFAERFGLERAPVSSGVAGAHRFRFLGANDLSAPDRLADPIAASPGETAYVLRPDGTGGWRYLGVARPTGDAWTLPEVDYATWRACGAGREVSRPTPAHALVEARALVERLLERGLTRLSQRGGNSATILGRASHGGLRVATGDGEGSRTISLTDLAWVRVAADDVAERGGLLDEARVNHHRYLAGTPAGSTRFIDTGWAIAAWQLDSENAVP